MIIYEYNQLDCRTQQLFCNALYNAVRPRCCASDCHMLIELMQRDQFGTFRIAICEICLRRLFLGLRAILVFWGVSTDFPAISLAFLGGLAGCFLGVFAELANTTRPQLRFGKKSTRPTRPTAASTRPTAVSTRPPLRRQLIQRSAMLTRLTTTSPSAEDRLHVAGGLRPPAPSFTLPRIAQRWE